MAINEASPEPAWRISSSMLLSVGNVKNRGARPVERPMRDFMATELAESTAGLAGVVGASFRLDR